MKNIRKRREAAVEDNRKKKTEGINGEEQRLGLKEENRKRVRSGGTRQS